jgi:hypothetical protein
VKGYQCAKGEGITILLLTFDIREFFMKIRKTAEGEKEEKAFTFTRGILPSESPKR